MSALDSYRRQNASSWTRIDMLLALYDFGIRTAAAGIKAIRIGDRQQLLAHQCKMHRVIVELLDGLDPEAEETSLPIQRLLHFISASVSTDTEAEWEAAQRVLSSLRDGFQQVRSEAVQLEQSGSIPHPDDDARAVSTLA